MQLARPAIAQHPFRFGRGPLREFAAPTVPARRISGDVKLFATTFIAGFVFASVLIG
jgi:hypothetical protein